MYIIVDMLRERSAMYLEHTNNNTKYQIITTKIMTLGAGTLIFFQSMIGYTPIRNFILYPLSFSC